MEFENNGRPDSSGNGRGGGINNAPSESSDDVPNGLSCRFVDVEFFDLTVGGETKGKRLFSLKCFFRNKKVISYLTH